MRRFSPTSMPLFTPIALLAFIALYLPVITLVVFSFNASGTTSDWGGFSLQGFAAAWQNEAVRAATARTLVIASSATLISTVCATSAALATTRSAPYRGRTVIFGMVNQTLMVPEIVTAVSLLIFFAAIRAATGYQGLAYLVLAHSVWCIPLAYLPIRARLAGMDRVLETAADDLYASRWQVMRRITLPLLVPGITAGAILAFVASLDTVVITEFVKSAGQDTLSTFMLGQLHRGVTPEVNAISTGLLVLTVLLLVAFFLLTRKQANPRHADKEM